MIVSLGALATAGVALAQDDESSKDASAIAADAARDTAKVGSYHLAGTLADKSGRTKIAADVFASGSGRLTLDGGGVKARFVALPGKLYVNANAAFWRNAGDEKLKTSIVRKLAGRWIEEPAKGGSSTVSLLGDLRPKQFASCLTDGVGTLSKAGTATVAGQTAIVLKDAGDKPGTAPSTYYFTSKAPVLPLKMVQNGAPRAGKAKDPRCGDVSQSESKDAASGSSLAFSRFGKVAKVTAPRGAVTVKEAVGGGGAGGDAPTTPA